MDTFIPFLLKLSLSVTVYLGFRFAADKLIKQKSFGDYFSFGYFAGIIVVSFFQLI